MKYLVLLIAALSLLTISAAHNAPVPPRHVPSDPMGHLALLERQAAILAQSMQEMEDIYYQDVAPIEARLIGRARDQMQARIAAWAIVAEANERDMSPRLIAEVLRMENPWLVRDTVSSAGALGWMQVMRMHLDDGHGCGPDLADGPTSVCYGVDIMRRYLGQALDDALRKALLKYNGCVTTPGCESYADRIMGAMQ